MSKQTRRRIKRVRMQGIALITVLLVVAIATTLGVGMLRSQYLALQYAGGLFNQDQAWLYTQGAEDLVRELLHQDFEEDQRGDRQTDHPGEMWARPLPAFPVAGGMIHARVFDQQARFNLNRVWYDNAPDPVAGAIFQRLLKSLDLPDNLVPALIDWIDEDNEASGPDGAEDDQYSRLAIPYRVANQPLSDVSELRLINGFTPEVINKLRPYVCALPATALLNINTADPTVVAALGLNMNTRNTTELASQRPTKGYATVDEFLEQPIFNGLDGNQKADLQKQLTVQTHYFQLLADADIGGRHSTVLAVIARSESGTLQVISRDYSQKFVAPTTADKTKNSNIDLDSNDSNNSNENTEPTMDSAVKSARDLL